MSEFKSGDRVTHPLFGAGVISAVAGAGADSKITVDFASNVGRKKLLASVANLRPQGSASQPQTEATSTLAVWVEALDTELRLRRNGRADRAALSAQIRTECAASTFWIRLREKIRARGQVAQMLDDPAGKVSVSLSANLMLRIRVAHALPGEARDSACARALLELLLDSALRDFQALNPRVQSGLNEKLEPDAVLEIADDTLELPDRAPLQRPKRVQPKGVIRSMPKRRDDY